VFHLLATPIHQVRTRSKSACKRQEPRRFAKNRKGRQPRGTVSKDEDTMSKHDTATKRHRRPKSAKRVDYTARTMAALKELEKAAKLRMKPA
jgi:hypothetical protein